MSDYEMVKQLYEWGFDVEMYAKLGTITQQEYEEITKLNRGEQNGEETS